MLAYLVHKMCPPKNFLWCRSLLSIGGIICNFTPILPYFQHWGGWTSTTILFRCGNLVKTKKKMQIEHFFSPNSGEDQKKKVFIKNRTLFLPDFRWRPKQKKKNFSKNRALFSAVHPIKLLGGMQMCTILKLLGGYSQKYWEDISPQGFGTPDYRYDNVWTTCTACSADQWLLSNRYR